MTATDAALATQAIAVLYQHRMATQTQLHQLLAPARSQQWISKKLTVLRRQGLADRIALPPGRSHVWFLTDYSRTVAADWPELRQLPIPPAVSTDPVAVRLRTAHTLTVLRAHLAFLADARRRGDEYGVLDWIPERHHKLTDQHDDAVIADALLRYTAAADGGGRAQFRAFVEVDRATMSSERLAAKLISYGRFLEYTPLPVGRRSAAQTQSALPLWQKSYPLFPRVLFVITNVGGLGLRNRIEDLKSMASGHPLAVNLVRKVPVGVARLEDIEEHGPSAAVWTALDGRDRPCGWMQL
ncbi:MULTISPECIES: replication-relaxation family protein [Streptacidiphilus]|uniref:Replication-relaxation family protein n=1 Tax=Streptacidiphilus cavernicola TaxID=3342716 RepID=A0ABV6UW83_9ACTN|nr:replication-relaxation family protein [Streptacidiphilus jeojiense]